MTHPKLHMIHKWLGVTFFVLFFLQGITGLVMANKHSLTGLEIGTSLATKIARPPLSLDETIEAVTALYPGYRLDRIIYPPDSSLPSIVRMKSKEHFWLRIIYLDPVTQAPVSHGPVWKYVAQFAERIHVSLLAGTTGHVVLMIEGLILTFMVVSGLIVWWPKKGRWMRALRISRKLGHKRLVRDLHTVPAVLLSPFLIVIGLSGFLMIAEPIVRPVIGLFAPVGQGLQLDLEKLERPDKLPGWQHSLEQIKATFPDDHVGQLRFVASARLLGAVIYTKKHTNPRAHHIVGVDRYSGETIVLERAGEGPSGDKVMEWFLPIHSGEIYGPFRSMLLSLLGFLLAALAVTGIIMWQQRRPSR